MADYRVILVDDESIILQGLQILIDWGKYGFQIVGCATNGLEGLELIEDLHPDLVISDIQMPDMNGVEMISQSYGRYPCKFIVLSGYSDFTYAQQCISYGVQEYLLKPIDEKELIQALGKVKIQIQSAKATDSAFIQLDNLNQQIQTMSMDELLRDIANSYFETEEDFFQLISDCAADFPIGQAYLAVSFEAEHASNLSQFRDLLAAELESPDYSYLLFYYGSNTYMCFFSLKTSFTEYEMKKKFQTLHSRITLGKDFSMCIGIGRISPTAHTLPLSCQQAIYALSFKNIRGINTVNPFDSNLENAYFIQTIPEDLWDIYRQSLVQSNFASISGALQKIFSYMTEISDMPVLGIQINTLNLIITCIQYLSEMQSFTSLSYENTDFMKQISTMGTSAELKKYAENTIYNLISSHRDTPVSKPTELISKVENYINKNYLQDLSLVNTAQMFHISPIHLSQTFKKQTGQLYLDYVTQVKINAAKKMLLTTDLMVYEIADQLHYKDHRYFSKLFEKKTGKKPSEFRKNPH